MYAVLILTAILALISLVTFIWGWQVAIVSFIIIFWIIFGGYSIRKYWDYKAKVPKLLMDQIKKICNILLYMVIPTTHMTITSYVCFDLLKFNTQDKLLNVFLIATVTIIIEFVLSILMIKHIESILENTKDVRNIIEQLVELLFQITTIMAFLVTFLQSKDNHQHYITVIFLYLITITAFKFALLATKEKED